MKVTLTISFEPGGPVNVNGPITDKILCYGMLEMARDAIKDFDPAKAPMITVPGRLGIFKANGDPTG